MNFAFIPAYPVWSLLIITVDVLVIYALSRTAANCARTAPETTN